jgi:plastocyanin
MITISKSRHRQQIAIALGVVGLALLLAGLRGVTASAGGAQASEDKVVRVSIENFAFRPATLKVDRGTRVAFANRSRAAHTATRAGSFDTGRIAAGKSTLVRFSRSGSFAYHCKIHPAMRGKIVVE